MARLQIVSAAASSMDNKRAALGISVNPAGRRTSVHSAIREARLKPEFASLYPGVQPDVWMPASAIGQQLLLWHLTAPAAPLSVLSVLSVLDYPTLRLLSATGASAGSSATEPR